MHLLKRERDDSVGLELRWKLDDKTMIKGKEEEAMEETSKQRVRMILRLSRVDVSLGNSMDESAV